MTAPLRPFVMVVGLDEPMLEVRTRAARSTASWTVPASIDVVRARLLNEVGQSPRARLLTSTNDTIDASVQGNAFSWGERITVRLTPTNGGTSVTAETRPVMPLTLFDWGEGERDIRLLHEAVPGMDGSSSQQAVIDGAPARLGKTSKFSRPVGWSVVVVAGLMIALGLVNLVVNTEHVESWLPLLVLATFALIIVLRDLRRR